MGASRIYVIDGSLARMGIAHQGTLPPPGAICRIEVASDWGPIRVDCEVVRTVERAMTQTQRPIFHSGLQIVVMDHQSAQRLQTMFESVSHDDF